VKCVVMIFIFFRHIELSSGLIDKDVKPREKFHPQQLFDGHFYDAEVPYWPMVFASTGASARRISDQEVISRRTTTDGRVCRSRQILVRCPGLKRFGGAEPE